jgi:osmoprotectant transport system ATP-binding protein
MDEPFSAVDPIVRAGLQDELIRINSELRKTIVLVTHDVEEAIKVGDRVAVFRPGGVLAQTGPPRELLGSPADDYVADFLGFDRGIRRLTFSPAAALHLDTDPVLDPGATAAAGRRRAKEGGLDWLLVTDSQRRPLGWLASAGLETLPDHVGLDDVQLVPTGHTFRVNGDSLRAALDATVLSRTGQAVGVDDDGRALGVTSYERLRTAIGAAAAEDLAAT